MPIDQVTNVVVPPMVGAVTQTPVQTPPPAQGNPAPTGQVATNGEVAQLQQKKTGVDAEKELNDAVKTTNRFMQALSQNLQFSVDKDTNKTVVKLVDTQTKDVIRQIPSEEMLSIAKALDKLQGLLLKDKA
jgi:flagellar protein FlaG